MSDPLFEVDESGEELTRADTVASAELSRGRTQWAWISASTHDGPSGSEGITIRVREG